MTTVSVIKINLNFSRGKWITMCSNLINYKPQVESRQQHLALYMDRFRPTVAIMIKVTSRRGECTLFNSDYSQLPAVALQMYKGSLFRFLQCVLHRFSILFFPKSLGAFCRCFQTS